MPLTISTKTYNFDTNPTPDSSKYTGPANTSTIKDIVIFKRTAPKATKTDNGYVKVAQKVVKTVLVNGVYKDMYGSVDWSYPVGALPADVTSLRTDVSSMVAAAPTQTLVDNGKISN